MGNKESDKEFNFRMDFITEVEKSTEKEDGSMVTTVGMIPDPKRYKTVEVDGEIVYEDKFTGYKIPLNMLEKIKFQQNAPVWYTPPKQEDYCSYL